MTRNARFTYLRDKDAYSTFFAYRVPNNDRPPLPRENCACQKKMKTPTASPFNSTSLLKSPALSVPSNGVTNNLKKGQQKKKLKTAKLFVN